MSFRSKLKDRLKIGSRSKGKEVENAKIVPGQEHEAACADEDIKNGVLTIGDNLGLKVLHSPDREEIQCDIVFLHGLTGNAYSTWIDQSSGIHWPRDLLKELTGIRISIFGYDANVAIFWGGASQNRLSNHAENLLGALVGLREETETEDRAIIFVAHSLGGLVCERALQMSESSAETHLRRVEEFTTGIVFMGTPHCGSDFAPFAKSVGKCLQMFGKRVNTNILDTLRRDSQVLLDVEDWFGNWRRRRNDKIRITCFFEELELPLIGKVVEESQARISGYSVYGIHANHQDMTKFSSKKDPGYIAIRAELRRWVRDLKAKKGHEDISKIDRDPEREQRVKKLLSKLYTCPYEERKDVNPDRIPGTCEWFLGHTLFRQWNEKDESAVLLVTADPGSGKSVLTKHLIDHVLSQQRVNICYFFFKSGFPDQQSALIAICSWTYQLCRSEPAIVDDALLERFEIEEQRMFSTIGSAWGIFLDLAKIAQRQIICVLDALDECNLVDFTELSTNICSLFNDTTRPNIKFLLTCRPYETMSWGFHDVVRNMPEIHLAGETEEEVEKIVIEIDLVIRHKIHKLAAKRNLEKTEENTLLEAMTSTPNRTYLWATLTLDSIETMHALTVSKLKHYLTHLPQTLDGAYERILSRSPDPDAAFRALQLIVAAKRPLMVGEIQVALLMSDSEFSHVSFLEQLEPNDRFAETLRNLLGLIIVVVHGTVHFLHQTAREFLVCKDPGSFNPSESMAGTKISWKHSILPRNTEKVAAEACVRCLNLRASSRSEELLSASSIFQTYAAETWVRHFLSSEIEMSSEMLSLAAQRIEYEARWLGKSALYCAVGYGLRRVVDMLLRQQYTDLNSNQNGRTGKTALSLAIEREDYEMVETLLCNPGINVKARNADGTTALALIARSHDEIIGRLALSKLKLSTSDLFELIVALYKDRIQGWIWDQVFWEEDAWKIIQSCPGNSGSKESPSDRSELRDHKIILRRLLTREKVPSQTQQDTLVQSIQTSNSEVAGVILKFGSVNLNQSVSRNETLLMLAINKGEREIAKWIIRVPNVDINIQQDTPSGPHNTALILAAETGQPGLVYLLVQAGANLHTRNLYGDTALTTAVRGARLDIIAILLQRAKESTLDMKKMLESVRGLLPCLKALPGDSAPPEYETYEHEQGCLYIERQLLDALGNSDLADADGQRIVPNGTPDKPMSVVS